MWMVRAGRGGDALTAFLDEGIVGFNDGNLAFYRSPVEAQRHYEMGMRIGAFSLGRTFDGALAWGLIDNRPFLRCLHGLGLCAWRLGHTREAAAVFHRMLWLNPTDNQGARFNLAAIEAGRTWEEAEGDR
jgi:hypothetical protein